jgi:4-amino-4-deoxy-L-arabinose transferase-like glycosyltransferase
MFYNKINKIIIFSFILKFIAIVLFHERNLSGEWLVLMNNFQEYKSYSYYVFNGQAMPSSYMPPLYFIFLLFTKMISFELLNYIYIVYFFQLLFSTVSVLLFYLICKNFLSDNYSILGAFVFSIFPILIFSCTLISSASLQLFLYLLFFNLYLNILIRNYTKINLFYFILVSSLCLLLRGEFLIIFLFSILYLMVCNKKKIIYAIITVIFTLMIISPYILRNYNNTGKPHITSVSGYALWKGNNQLSKVEGFVDPLDPAVRYKWPKIEEFNNLYKKLDGIKQNNKYEINRDKIFLNEAIKNIIQDKKKYLILYLKKFSSYLFVDLNSSNKDYYNFIHIVPLLIFSTLSLPGMILAAKKPINKEKTYLLLIVFLISALLSFFFILPRYKIIIIGFQIIFSLYFIEHVLNKLKKK